jgi:hypothetical protein
MPRRVSASVQRVDELRQGLDLQLTAEVWLGPLSIGDEFTAVFHDPDEDAVALRVGRVTVDGAERGQAESGAIVQLVLEGDGGSFVAVGDVLLGGT